MERQWVGIAHRLETAFGLGDVPLLSRRLYRRLECICQKHGDRAYQIVVEVKEAAAFADFPGKWFRAGVLRAMLEEGIIKELRPRTSAGDRVVNQIAAQVARGTAMPPEEASRRAEQFVDRRTKEVANGAL
jgi:hypothetical protein